MSSDTVQLVVRFRGWRWPLRAGDVIEVWHGLTALGEVPTDLLRQMLGHHLATARLQAVIADRLAPLPGPIPLAPLVLDVPAAPRKPLAPLPPHTTREGRAALRARRKAR